MMDDTTPTIARNAVAPEDANAMATATASFAGVGAAGSLNSGDPAARDLEQPAIPTERLESALSRSDQPDIELAVEDLNHFVPISGGFCRKGKKQVLFNVSARFQSGQLCALMGPSGAGKTSLLGVLSRGHSSMRLNGEALPRAFSNLCVTIPQADILYPALTAEQTLHYSALLRLPQETGKERIASLVASLLDDLQLTKCKDTPVGNENIRGVSGGERKRVSIGVELVTNPSVLFVDEPTSGLDSKMAEDTVQLLKNLARNAGRLVICTIHQPSWGIFTKFDKLLMLHHGRVVYHGEAKGGLQRYFSSIGYHAPEFENPLDYFMRELQLQDKQDKLHFPNRWSKLAESEWREYDAVASGDFSKPLTPEQIKRMRGMNSSLHQFLVLLRRNAHDTIVDKEKFVQGLGMKLGIGLLLGIVFVGQGRKDTVASIFPTTSPLFFLVLSAAFDTLLKSVMEYPTIRALVVREYKNGAFSFAPYFLAQVINNMFFDILSSLFYSPAYFLVGLGPTAWQFFIFLAGISLVTIAGSALGLAVGSFAKDFKDAQGYIMPLLMPLLIFSGFLLPLAEIPDVFVWIYWISPFQYCLSSLLINNFRTKEFVDGPSGLVYLEQLGLSVDDVGRNFGILAGIDAVLLIVCFFVVRRSILKQARTT